MPMDCRAIPTTAIAAASTATDRLQRAGSTEDRDSVFSSGGGFGRRLLSFVAVMGSRARLQPLAQVGDQPTSSAARQAAALVDDVDRQGDFVLAVGDIELLQPAGRDVVGDHVARHVAPAEAGKQEIEAGGEIREPPEVTADDPADPVLR